MIPFGFEQKERSVNVLLNKLERMGLELVEERQAYREKLWVFRYRWLTEELKLIWLQNWVSDGTSREDVGARLTYGTETLDEFAFNELLVETKSSLRGSIIKRITRNLSKATGKRT